MILMATIKQKIRLPMVPTTMATPRRAVVGWDTNRLAMILAVLQTHCNMRLADKEVYLNVAGGMKISEPAADLAVAAAIASSLANTPIASGGIIFGEIGLSGEVRQVSQPGLRLKEAEKLGFTYGIVPPDTDYKSKSFILKPIPYITQLSRLLAANDQSEAV